MIKFQLVKKNPVQWNVLQVAESLDKEFMKRKRDEAIRKAHERAEKEHACKAAEKREQEKIALREQMKVIEQFLCHVTVFDEIIFLPNWSTVVRGRYSTKLFLFAFQYLFSLYNIYLPPPPCFPAVASTSMFQSCGLHFFCCNISLFFWEVDSILQDCISSSQYKHLCSLIHIVNYTMCLGGR